MMGTSSTAGGALKAAAALEAVAAALGTGDVSARLGAGGGPWGHSIPSAGSVRKAAAPVPLAPGQCWPSSSAGL